MAEKEARRALSENESKQTLAAYGVPAAPGTLARDSREAMAAAENYGVPVAVKGHGEGLAHKTEMNLVRLGLKTPEDAQRAAEEIFALNPPGLDGVLVGPMIPGKREFVAGLFRDPVFGPVVMFGLGGVFTEALKDAVFAIAPFDEGEAARMIDGLKSSALLGPFRGEKAADRDALIKTLTGLARLGVERPEVLEVDVNPLLVGPDGSVTAVDALVVTGEPMELSAGREPIPTRDLAAFFHPKSVAFIGASATLAKWGNVLPLNLIAGGFPGAIHLVNSAGGEMWGRKVYKTVEEIPGEVDLAVVTVPAAKVMGLIPGIKAKGIERVLLITSGFGETGPEGKELEKELVAAAKKAGILLFGPNTMGILNPHTKAFMTGVHVRVEPGSTTLVSQSGNMGVQLLEFAASQGLGIRAFGGSGNEAMISVEDFMEGFEVDEKTSTVLLYVESAKDGRRFYQSAKRLGKKKPVIVLKGGRSEAGNQAAKSHTGAMATDFRIFDAACRQAGIVTVEKPVEMLDASAVFSSLPLPRGKRVAIMTLGGGWGVVTSDLCADRGLVLPELDPEVLAALDKLLPPYWSRANPVDLVGENDPELPKKAIDILAAWDGCDAIINLGIFGRKGLLESLLGSAVKVDQAMKEETVSMYMGMADRMEEDYLACVASAMERHDKPIIGVNLVSGQTSKSLYDVPGHKYKGVFFSSPERAVNALYHMTRYREFLER